VIHGQRARHRALCAAWWVHTARRGSCTLFYEVRMARPPSRRLVVIQTFQPWCAGLPWQSGRDDGAVRVDLSGAPSCGASGGCGPPPSRSATDEQNSAGADPARIRRGRMVTPAGG
jgi:hypothetical protein